MLHRGYMRRGVSLEVIVEEDDNAEVSLDPIYFKHELDSVPSSPSSSTDKDEGDRRTEERDEDGWTHGEERERRRKRRHKKEGEEEEKEERWRHLATRRSLSCETLTILDVGDDEFSREQWEEEARDWATEDVTGFGPIQHSISRRKILASRTDDQYDGVDHENQETLNPFDNQDHIQCTTSQEGEDEAEDGRCWNPDKAEQIRKDLEDDNDGNEQDLKSFQRDYDEGGEKETSVDADEAESGDFNQTYEDAPLIRTNDEFQQMRLTPDNGSPILCNRPPDLWLQDPFTNDQDSWITVGELISGTPEPSNGTPDPSTSTPSPTPQTPSPSSEEDDSSKPKIKEVRFSDKVEFVNEQMNPTVSTSLDESLKKVDKYTPNSDVLRDPLVSVRTGRDLFEGKRSNEGSTSFLPDRIMMALENPQVMIVERNYSQDQSQIQMDRQQEEEPPFDPKPPSYNTHNVELHPEELPPPHTVASVRQLFESHPAGTLHTHDVFQFESRFDHVRSNPSSKILRFDRDRQKQSSPFIAKMTVSSSSSSSSSNKSSCKGTPIKRGATSTAKDDFSSTGVHLRKPRVASGFDVRKALRENPRYFHIRVGERSKKGKAKHTDGNLPSKGPNAPLSRRNTVTYSYLEAKSQNQRGSTTTLRWTKETIDRSDAESMSSESSEDSGVSRDFSSSILTSFSTASKKNNNNKKWPCHHHLADEYASDPSFKWIDPSVLSKIRSMGTTVIYFGPRHRPQGSPQPRHSWGTFNGDTKRVTLLTNVIGTDERNGLERRRGGGGGGGANHHHINSNNNNNNNNCTHHAQMKDSPRIVGVVHKKGLPFKDTQGIRTNGHATDADIKIFPHRDSTLLLHTREAKRKSTGDNSIVYNFTQTSANEVG